MNTIQKKLKLFCAENGLDYDYHKSGVAIISEQAKMEQADPWYGVEFITGKKADTNIYRLIKNHGDWVKYVDINGKKHECGIGWMEPSTEEAYVDQLKKEAFERFVEIKEGDRFKFDSLEWVILGDSLKFNYFKESDSFSINNMVIYQKGKWAERVKERVEVRLTGHPTWTPNDAFGYNFCFHFKVKNGGENMETFKAGQFLAAQLESYLNGEIKPEK